MTHHLGIVGLGRMGLNLALNAAGRGFRVHGLEPHAPAAAAAESSSRITVHTDSARFLKALPTPRVVFLMVTSGHGVDQAIDQLIPLLSAGDCVIDGGNSHFRDTIRRSLRLRAIGVEFIGAGISGGPSGALNGPAIMAGGTREAWDNVAPILTELAAQTGSGPCADYVGPHGAGHFVKMIHNGIEYGAMQSLAELHQFLAIEHGLNPDAISDQFSRLNRDNSESLLTAITAEAANARTDDGKNYIVDIVDDHAEQNGTGRWTIEAALEIGVAVPTLGAAVFARIQSASSADLRKDSLSDRVARPALMRDDDLSRALAAAFVACFTQGFDILAHAESALNMEFDLPRIAKIWRGGCILQGSLINRIADELANAPKNVSILKLDGPRSIVQDGLVPLRRLVERSALHGLPAPALAASLAYFDMQRIQPLPTRMVNLQRGFFGSHNLKDRRSGRTFQIAWPGFKKS